MLNFNQSEFSNVDLTIVNHLLDLTEQLKIDTSLIAGLDSLTDQEQITELELTLQEMIKAKQQEQLELERESLYACNIGPYANGICTICGGRQPK